MASRGEDSRPEPRAVLLIAHGSRHQPANEDLLGLATRLERSGRHAIVEASFLELTEPDILTGGSRCVERGARRVLMVPYFLSAGVHLLRDLTAARDELKRRFPKVSFVLGPPLGPHPLLDQLVAARIDELEHDVASPVLVSSEAMAIRFAPMDGKPD
jgi:sirohydrochlorin ferrochelatase